MVRAMRTLAVLPVKNFGDAKQRLSGALGAGSRQALAQAMFSDVVGALRRCRLVESVAVVTGDPAAEAAAQGGRVMVLPDPAPGGQSAAALTGIRYALSAGFERVLLVPGDTPLIEPSELDGLLERSADERLDVVIVPDRHGEGTNGLLLRPPDAIVPSFGEGSRARHVRAAEEAGLEHRVEHMLSLIHDVDTPDDLAALESKLEDVRGVAPLTRGALRQLGRARAAQGDAVTKQLEVLSG
jgi:2-phospho-L-lactate/phosphoenolpyruvate guanylyltransferase